MFNSSPLIDTHTHLSSEEYDKDRSEMLVRAFEKCDVLIDIGSGTSPEAFNKARALAETDPRIYFTAGVHPHDADAIGSNAKILESIEALTSHPKCVAVGECGLDYYYNHSDHQNQIKVFEWHRELSKKANLPLMIHTRDAEADTIKVLDAYSGPVVFHCFTGTQELADFAIAKGFYISLSGIVTFKTAEALRSTAKTIPMTQLLVETDAPFLAPIPCRGKRNESAFVEHTAKFLADLKGISFEDFATQTSANARRLFSKIQARA